MRPRESASTAGSGQIKFVDIAGAAYRVEQSIRGNAFFALQVGDHAAFRQFFHAFHLFIQAHGHAAVAQVIAQRLHDLLIGELQQLGPSFRSE